MMKIEKSSIKPLCSSSSKNKFLYNFKKIISKNRILLEFFVYSKGFLRGGFSEAKISVLKLRRIYPKAKRVPCKISKSLFRQQSSVVFEKEIKFSILVPLYNTPINYLKEMINSVKNQSYNNWELCLADGSDASHDYVEKYCSSIASSDSRIIYKKLKENKGISANTNECIKLASGNYIALFDHDDVLHPSALFECAKAICEQNADYVYTDEVVFLGNNIKKIINYHFKPDFAPENLLANNYICHFSVFDSKLIEQTGVFRSEFDGSQDHDLILRLTQCAENIVHIPKILYYWRSHSNSVAMDINSKKYAINAGIGVVQDYLNNNGIIATVESSPAFPVIYKINYKILNNPKISLIITTNGDIEKLTICLNSILQKTTYSNYEITIVGNFDANDARLFEYAKINSSVEFKFFNVDSLLTHYSMYNYAAARSDGDFLLFLHDDTEILSENWIEELLMYAQRDCVGAVGGKHFQSDNTIRHSGYILGLGDDNIADDSHKGVESNNLGYMGKLFYAQNITAVSDACLMVKKDKFEQICGFNENIIAKYGDVDFCLRLQEIGLSNIFNPYCVLVHNEHNECNYDIIQKDIITFKDKWSDTIEKGDPYYNPNLSLVFSYLIK